MLSKVHQVGNYSVSETETKRTQDLQRFVVTKKSARKGAPYVVTFQTHHQFGCSCPAGRSQKHCKHVTMCMALYGK